LIVIRRRWLPAQAHWGYASVEEGALGGPTDGYVSTNSLRLHYRDWGGAGRPMVLLHGLSSNARIWDFVAPLLTGVARVIALDQRGHGGSDRPEDGYGFEDVTADLSGALRELGLQRPLIVGHSWGANVAVTIAAAYPDVPAGIALVDGGTFDLSTTPEMTWEKAERMMAPPRIAGTPRTRFLQLVRAGELRGLWSDEVKAIIMAGFDVAADDTVAPRLTFERHMKIVRAIWDYHPASLLPAITCPILMLPCAQQGSDWTARKRVAVAEVERIAPNARTVWFEDAIHDVPLQQPERVAEALSAFVTELGG
jgi:pimeloyl-ACP methyl ester carboxylesterase